MRIIADIRGDGVDRAGIQEQAEEFVAYYQDDTGSALDYSEAGIGQMDAFLEGLHQKRVDPADVADLVIGVACYVGEVIRRNLGGAWADDGDAAARGGMVFNPSIVVGSLPIRPVDAVCNRIETGEAESLSGCYASLARRATERSST
ncbi:hypothetical protein [Sphingomonas taxi]|uniref:hypothetical protein n=1 Tax=Sphingomonas taxi TaxID=1549858 RepID=UPI0012E022D7|nr:hypothetical protein [Sphingomonas taxi]